MAVETKKATRKGVARQVKDIKGIILYKGSLEGEVRVVFDPWEAMEAKDGDNTLQSKSFTVPRKRRAPTNQGTGEGAAS
jgi:hypothetical protein